jgi:hypothetical protein
MISEEEFIELELERAGCGPYLPKETVEHFTNTARKKYARLMVQREEWLDVKTHYELWAHRSLKEIKKTPGPRSVLTVTIPTRMIDRLNGLPRGNKSAYVTRLLARGWLSQMDVNE